MFQRIVRSIRVLERTKEKGLLKTLGQSIYSVQEAVPVYLNLADLKLEKHALGEFGSEIRLIMQESQIGHLLYPAKSRGLQVKSNLRKGYNNIILIKKGRIIGDIWFAQADQKCPQPHRDLEIFNIELKPDEAYAFDLFVLKQERGKDLTTSFMTSALREIRARGVNTVYGCYMAKNIPALWIHRLVGYKELPRVKVRNLLWHRAALR